MMSDAEMPDAEDDGNQGQTYVSRPKASEIRARKVSELDESVEDYEEFFQQLQIKPERYQEFFDGIIYVIRQKHLNDLRRGTAASIKSLTNFLLRGYGYVAWPPSSTWLVKDPGEERLVHVRGGTNDRYASSVILAKTRRHSTTIVLNAPPLSRQETSGPKLTAIAKIVTGFTNHRAHVAEDA